MNDTVGHQAQTIRHKVSTKDGHKSPSTVKFIAEFTSPKHKDSPEEPALWTIHTDGSST